MTDLKRAAIKPSKTAQKGRSTFVIDAQTSELLDQLKEAFGSTTKADVLRKALKLAKVAADNLDADHNFTFVTKDDEGHEQERMIMF